MQLHGASTIALGCRFLLQGDSEFDIHVRPGDGGSGIVELYLRGKD